MTSSLIMHVVLEWTHMSVMVTDPHIFGHIMYLHTIETVYVSTSRMLGYVLT